MYGLVDLLFISSSGCFLTILCKCNCSFCTLLYRYGYRLSQKHSWQSKKMNLTEHLLVCWPRNYYFTIVYLEKRTTYKWWLGSITELFNCAGKLVFNHAYNIRHFDFQLKCLVSLDFSRNWCPSCSLLMFWGYFWCIHCFGLFFNFWWFLITLVCLKVSFSRKSCIIVIVIIIVLKNIRLFLMLLSCCSFILSWGLYVLPFICFSINCLSSQLGFFCLNNKMNSV